MSVSTDGPIYGQCGCSVHAGHRDGCKRGPLPPNPKQAYGDKKINLALVPPASIAYEALALMEGARKYGPFKWRDKAVEAMTYVAAAMRHIGQWQDGEEIDAPSGKPHLGMAKACLGILIDALTVGNLIDNRPKPGSMTKVLADNEAQVAVADTSFDWAERIAEKNAEDRPYPEGAERCKGWTWKCHKEAAGCDVCGHECEYPITAAEKQDTIQPGVYRLRDGFERLAYYCVVHHRWYGESGCAGCAAKAGSSR